MNRRKPQPARLDAFHLHVAERGRPEIAECRVTFPSLQDGVRWAREGDRDVYLFEVADVLANTLIEKALADAVRAMLDTDVVLRGRPRRFACPFCDVETLSPPADGGSDSMPLMEAAHTADCPLRKVSEALEAFDAG